MTSTTEKKRSDVSGLPPGWQREETMRMNGLSAGKIDVYYISPDGEKMRSKPQLARKLGDSFDLSCFDFRSGKLLQSALRKNKGIKGSGYDYTRGKKQRGRKARSVGRPRVIKNIGQKKLTAAAKAGKKRPRGRPRGSEGKKAKKQKKSSEEDSVDSDEDKQDDLGSEGDICKKPYEVKTRLYMLEHDARMNMLSEEICMKRLEHEARMNILKMELELVEMRKNAVADRQDNLESPSPSP